MRNYQLVLGHSVLPVVLFLAIGVSRLAAADRTYSTAHVVVDLGGERQVVSAVQGGSAVGVVAVAPGSEGKVDKRLTGVKYDDISMSLPLANVPTAIREVLAGKRANISGGVEYADHAYKGERRMSFQNAVVSSIRFPALDAGSKDSPVLQLVLAPENTREESMTSDLKGVLSSKAKRASSSNFKVTIPDVITNRVSAVSAIEVRAKGKGSPGGQERAAARETSSYDISNITLSVSAVDLKSWQEWHEKSISEGGSKQEKTMRLELLEPNMKEALLTLDFSGVGIIAVRHQKVEPGSEKVPRFDVELYAEQLVISPGSGGSGKSASAAETSPPAEAPKAAAAPAESAPAPVEKPVRRAR